MEGTEINEVEGLDSPVDPDECDKARLIGEIIREFVIGLGHDQAATAYSVVEITPAASSGRGQPGRSECDPRAILDAESGGCLGAVLSHRNFVCPRPHCQAAAWGREAAASANSSRDATPSRANAAQCSAGMLLRLIHERTVCTDTPRARATASAAPARLTMSE